MSNLNGTLSKEISEQSKKDSTYVDKMKDNPRAAIIRELEDVWDFSEKQTSPLNEAKEN
ncbi:MAG: hypothetical protein ACR2O7_05845 [Parasphingorhabdus sp.]